ncbi:MAG: UTP--glucose-1-phosphate uridylyltransferase GalU [Chloroflexi bacterium]|nr:UTP--glucose-1-phosphate uridylyltransferase GalU [Chloroflexota bacterium]
MKIRKAVIVAGGWGTRFLPITRSQPKEMLPLVDKPVIQYAVEEAIAAGMEQVVLVTALGKRAIEDYFDRAFELEYYLEQRGEKKLLQEMRNLSNMIDICYVRQKGQLGLGHAVLTARHVIEDEAFAVFLPDDIVDGKTPLLRQLVDVYERYKGSVIAVERVSREDTVKYGVIDPKEIADRVFQVMNIVEKPTPEEAPSDLTVMGRYVLTPEIFDILEATPPGKNNEIQLTDAIQILLQKQAVYACEFEGTRYDTGNPWGWLKATISLAMKRPDIAPDLRDYLKQLL